LILHSARPELAGEAGIADVRHQQVQVLCNFNVGPLI
jgi:hypothetical protein